MVEVDVEVPFAAELLLQLDQLGVGEVLEAGRLEELGLVHVAAHTLPSVGWSSLLHVARWWLRFCFVLKTNYYYNQLQPATSSDGAPRLKVGTFVFYLVK